MTAIIIPDSIRSARGEAHPEHEAGMWPWAPLSILAIAIVCWVPVAALIWAVC